MMTETSGSNHKQTKSKWGKLLKHSDSDSKQKFRLNDDVQDFLKPSTEKYSGLGTRPNASPKIDPTFAQRWPDAAELRRASEANTFVPSPLPAASSGRARRRKGLVVRFVQTAPDIIGHGGDETETPTVEVSRQRANVARSRSDRISSAPSARIAAEAQNIQHVRPGTLQRAETHQQGTSTSYQRPMDPDLYPRPFESGDGQLPRPGLLARTPTGAIANVIPPSPEVDQEPHWQRREAAGSQEDSNRYLDDSKTAETQHRMRAEEGRMFQRAFSSSQDGNADPDNRLQPSPSPEHGRLSPSERLQSQATQRPRASSHDVDRMEPSMQHISLESTRARGASLPHSERPSRNARSPLRQDVGLGMTQAASQMSRHGNSLSPDSRSRHDQDAPPVPVHRDVPSPIRVDDYLSYSPVPRSPGLQAATVENRDPNAKPQASPRNFARPIPSPSLSPALPEQLSKPNPPHSRTSPGPTNEDTAQPALAEFGERVSDLDRYFEHNAENERSGTIQDPMLG